MDAIRIILASIKRADSDFNLINDKDRIAIGVSGGKDSMALLYIIYGIRRSGPLTSALFHPRMIPSGGAGSVACFNVRLRGRRLDLSVRSR